MDTITAKSTNIYPGGNASFRFTLPMSFIQLFQVVLELLARWESNSMSSTSPSGELSLIDKALNADVVCSPDGRNSSSLEKDIEKTCSVCE